jgi:hypothetical protein
MLFYVMGKILNAELEVVATCSLNLFTEGILFTIILSGFDDSPPIL